MTLSEDDINAAGRPEGIKLLVVDDVADNAEMLALLCEFEGYQAKTAHSGRTALQIAQEFEPDVVLCDIGLPDIDGFCSRSRVAIL